MKTDTDIFTNPENCAKAAHTWLMEAAFPLWASRGIAPSGGFCEALTLGGEPGESSLARVRVQARQIHVFCAAAELGWQTGTARSIIADGVAFLTAACRRPDGLYGRTVDLEGGLVDETADLYDCSFVLFALASAVKATGSASAQAAGADLNRAIDALLKAEEGFLEQLPHGGVRAQNPHMHLLEASLAWLDATGDETARVRAQAIIDLLMDRFFDASIGALREVFATDWSAHADDRLEAGHQFAWVWLLSKAERAGLDVPLALRDQLYATARGLTGPNGQIALSHNLDGAIREPVYRTWSLTEALKAHLRMEPENGRTEALRTFNHLWTDHLTTPVRGGWRDKLNSGGALISTNIPASTGYHIVLAMQELFKATGFKA